MKKHRLLLICFCLFTSFIKSQENNTAQATAFYKTAQHKVELEQYDSATYYFGRAIDLHYPDKKVYGNRGVNESRQEKYAEALIDYDTALKYMPDNALLLCNKGIALARLKRNEEAITYFNLALKIDSTDAETYSCRGVTYQEMNDSIAALKDYNHAIILSPNFADYYYNRARLFKDSKLAIKDYEKAIKLEPGMYDAYYNLGVVYLNTDKFKNAISIFQKALLLTTDHKAEVNYELAECYWYSNKNDKACVYFKLALSLGYTGEIAKDLQEYCNGK
ncbi:MAG: repeat-containing protein [Bacteroidetes bacterium]|nr:repeat-containing protein [Bacteroidota bacterium]